MTDVSMGDPFPITVTYEDGGIDTFTVLEYHQLRLVGTDGQCSPRHTMPFNSRNATDQNAIDDVASTIHQPLAPGPRVHAQPREAPAGIQIHGATQGESAHVL